MTQYKVILGILETAITKGIAVTEACSQAGVSERMVRDFIYDLKRGRRSLPSHLKERLLIFYDRAKNQTNPDKLVLDKAKKLLEKNSGKALNIAEASDFLQLPVGKTREILEYLKEEGYAVDVAKDTNKVLVGSSAKALHTIAATHKFGALGDTHFGSKYERRDLLELAYDRFAELGITTVFHTGNWIDGEARFNFADLHTHGMDNQINYMIENYPKREGITTYFISGDDHEGWYQQKVAMNIGKYLELCAQRKDRTDLVFLGHMEADVMLGNTRVRVLHPGGGSAYAISYTSQKIVESYSEHEKPDILLHGHYHKFEYLFLRGIHVFQTGCFEDQTPFMRKKRLSAHLGCWALEFMANEEGRVVEMVQRPLVYYNTPDHNVSWSYKE
jgi:predicted phosphodiesterase